MNNHKRHNNNGRSIFNKVALDLLEEHKGESSFDKYHRVSKQRGYYVLESPSEQPPMNRLCGQWDVKALEWMKPALQS